MNNNLITIIIYSSVFIFFVFLFLIFYIVFNKKINYWLKYYNKAKLMFNDENIIESIFNTNNLSKRYLETNWKLILLIYTLLLGSQLGIESVATALLIGFFFPSIYIPIICFILIVIKTTVLFYFFKWEVKKMHNYTNKKFYKTKQTYKYVFSAVVPVGVNKKDNIDIWNLIYKLYYKSLNYIKDYKCFLFWTEVYTDKDRLEFKINNRVRNIPDVDKTSFDITYVSIVKEYKIIEKIFEYKIIDFNSKEELTKEQIINYLVSKIFILSTTYIEQFWPEMIILNPKKCVDKALNFYDEWFENN